MVREEHKQFVVDNAGKMTPTAIREALERKGLTKSQANSCTTNQRVKLGLYRNASLEATYESFKGGNKPGKWKFKGGQPLKVEKGDKYRDKLQEF